MLVNSVNRIIVKNTDGKKDSQSTKKSEQKKGASGDSYEKAKPDSHVTYTVNLSALNRMKAELNTKLFELNALTNSSTKGQAYLFEYATGKIDWDNFSANFLKLRFQMIEFEVVTPEAQSEAEEMIGEDGYFGVKNTAKRILDFAKLFGGDNSRIGILKKAFMDGFDAAEKVWGDKLPEICYQTYDKVMEGFLEMEKEAGVETKEE